MIADDILKKARNLLGLNKKKRQHHVWQKYLRSWETDGRVFCLSDKKIFGAKTNSLAVENYFYRVERLTPQDVSLLKWLVVDAANPYAQKVHQELLAYFVSTNLLYGKSLEIDSLLDLFRTNALENYHANIESAFIPILESILRHDLAFYNSKNECITFFAFLSSQFMRTKGIKERSIQVVRDKNGLDISRIWPLMSHMFAVNVGAAFFSERQRRSLSVIQRNGKGTGFITSDQPVINLLGLREEPREKISIYYPFSPDIALILSEEDTPPLYSTDALTPDHVAHLNNLMARASHRQVFANSEQPLRSLLLA